mgnify:CR=1 FL=1
MKRDIPWTISKYLNFVQIALLAAMSVVIVVGIFFAPR